MQEPSEELKIIEPVLSSKAHRKKWAAWIKRIWNSDPLTCPKCGQKMQIIAFIEDNAVIKKVLTSLDMWKIPERLPPDLSHRGVPLQSRSSRTWMNMKLPLD